MITKGRLIGVAVIAAIVVVLAVLFTPSIVLGVDEEALGSSVSRAAQSGGGPLGGFGKCSPAGESFACSAWVPSGDVGDYEGGRVTFEVEVNWLGCWDATPAANSPDRETLEGCIFLWDY